MRLETLAKSVVQDDDYGSLAIEKIVASGDSYNLGNSSATRYFLSPFPIAVTINEKLFMVPERSAVKIHPGRDVAMGTIPESYFILFTLAPDEESYLAALSGNPHFQTLDGKDLVEWIGVKDKPLDYLLEGERNAEHIKVQGDLVIAPPHSRFHPYNDCGWNLMYARASRALGIAIDFKHKVRSVEIPHAHKVMHEFNIQFYGETAFGFEGKDDVIATPGTVLISDPGEMHYQKDLIIKPHFGLTVQFPSIPGDKYDAAGARIHN